MPAAFGSMIRGDPISSSRNSFWSRPSSFASSAANDCTANARGTLETERNHPIRVCAIALPFSHRMLAISNGMSTKPMPVLDRELVARRPA